MSVLSLELLASVYSRENRNVYVLLHNNELREIQSDAVLINMFTAGDLSSAKIWLAGEPVDTASFQSSLMLELEVTPNKALGHYELARQLHREGKFVFLDVALLALCNSFDALLARLGDYGLNSYSCLVVEDDILDITTHGTIDAEDFVSITICGAFTAEQIAAVIALFSREA